MRNSKAQFIQQQGVSSSQADGHLYSALMFQPRTIGALVALGIVLQTPWLFLALSAVLVWSALVPTRNPFDAIYNYVVAYPRGLPPLEVSPTPRRISAGMAGTLALAIGVALLVGAAYTSWVLEGLLVAAVMAVVLLRLCPGSIVYRLAGRGASSEPVATPQRAASRRDGSDPSMNYSHGR